MLHVLIIIVLIDGSHCDVEEDNNDKGLGDEMVIITWNVSIVHGYLQNGLKNLKIFFFYNILHQLRRK